MNYREKLWLRIYVQQGVLCRGQVGECSEDGEGSTDRWLGMNSTFGSVACMV